MFSCRYCELEFKTKKKLKGHHKIKHAVTWLCNFCDERYDKFVLYEEHLNLKHSDLKKGPDCGSASEKSIKKDDLCCTTCKWFWVIDHDESDLCLRVYDGKKYCKKCLRMVDEEKNILLKYGNYLNQLTIPSQSHEKQLWIECKLDLRYIQVDVGAYEMQFWCCYCVDVRERTKSFYHLAGWPDHEICERCFWHAVCNKKYDRDYHDAHCIDWCPFNNHLKRNRLNKIN